jgi:hypothetical protein
MAIRSSSPVRSTTRRSTSFPCPELAPAVAVDANRDDHRDRDDAPDTGLAALESRDLVQMCQVFALQHVSSV